MNRLQHELHPERRADLGECLVARFRVRLQRPVERFARNPGLLGNFGHAACARNFAQGRGEQGRIVVLQDDAEVLGYVGLILQVLGGIEFGQIFKTDFLGRKLPLKISREFHGLGNIGGLRGLVAPAQHHD
jgi:hypothetical protein